MTGAQQITLFSDFRYVISAGVRKMPARNRFSVIFRCLMVLSKMLKLGALVPSRKVGAVIADDDRLLCCLPLGQRASGWLLPRFPAPRKRARREVLERCLRESLGLKNFEIQHRLLRRRTEHDSTDWWLVKTADGAWQTPLRRPAGIERLDWVKRDIVHRYGPPEYGQRQLLDQYHRLVHDSYSERLPEQRMILDGVELCYSDMGDKSKPPLVLVHGLGSDLQIFRWNARCWASKHRVIAIDLPGHGQSEKADIDYTMGLYVRVIQRFLDRLEIKRTHLLGYSMGGLVSTLFAAQFPDRIRRLVLLAPAGYRKGKKPLETLRRVSRAMRNPLYPLFRERFLRSQFKSFYHSFTPEIDLLFEETLAGSGRRDYLCWLRAVGASLESITRNPSNELYSQIKAQTLILFGEQDRIVPVEGGFVMARTMPHANIRLYPNCGHSLVIEARDKVTQDVLSFLKNED
jgi:pimeloyl-ACP methyl ester carboxylesterase